MFKRRIRLLVLAVIVTFSVTMVSAYYTTSTQTGAKLIVRILLSKYLQFSDVEILKEEGSLIGGLTLRQVKIVDPQELPKGSVLTMREVHFSPLLTFGKDWLGFTIHDLKWKSPYSAKDVVIKKVRGHPMGGLWFYGVESEGLKGLPQNSLLEIQKLNTLFSLTPKDLQSVENGRINLPYSAPVVFSGRRSGQNIEGRIHCTHLDLREAAVLFPDDTKADKIEGAIDGLDVSVSNVLQKEPLRGEIRFKKLMYHDFMLVDCIAAFDAAFKIVGGKLEVRGRIDLKQGTIMWKGNAIKLSPGKIIFSGDPLNPLFDLKGSSVIGDTTISAGLKGFGNAPDFKLSSDSGLSQKRLFFMFMVGKSLKNILFMPFLAGANSSSGVS